MTMKIASQIDCRSLKRKLELLIDTNSVCPLYDTENENAFQVVYTAHPAPPVTDVTAQGEVFMQWQMDKSAGAHLRRALLAQLRWDGQDTPIQELPWILRVSQEAGADLLKPFTFSSTRPPNDYPFRQSFPSASAAAESPDFAFDATLARILNLV
jgi:hypothetical protein